MAVAGLIAVGRWPFEIDVVGVASAIMGFAVLLPREKPMPKKMAHSTTSPKNKASILPVPSVISVSSDFAILSSLDG